MPEWVKAPTQIPVPGGKVIQEFVGKVNTQTDGVSVACMNSPAGWTEPGQTPDFTEYTVVLEGCLRVEHKDGVLDVEAGQAVITHPGEWVRYSTPQGARYVAICAPAFTLDGAKRDPEGVA